MLRVVSNKSAIVKILLRLLRGLVDRGIIDIGLHPLDAADDVAGREQHGSDHKLLHAIGVRAGRVEHHNALLGVFGMGYVVHACACAGHRQQVFARGEFVHLCASHEHGVGRREVLRTGIAVRKVVESHIRNRIEAHVLIVHFEFFLFRVYRRKPVHRNRMADNYTII